MYPDADFTISLLTSSAWDRTLGWFVNTGSKSVFEVAVDSTSWGNYVNSQYTLTTGAYGLDTFQEITEDSPLIKQKGDEYKLKTGSSDLFCVNNVFDFAGNAAEWVLSTEHDDSYFRSRGGCFMRDRNQSFVTLDSQTSVFWEYVSMGQGRDTGFRAAIYL